MHRLAGFSVFVEVVESGSFSLAATRLNLSRSAVSKTIAGLEARLGTRLFHRTTRSQSLTDEGQTFYAHCLKALEELRAGEQSLKSGRCEIGGRLRVSMPVLFGRRCVAPILLRLAENHPALSLELDFNDRVVDLVQDGFDLAVRNPTPGNDASLVARRIARQPMVLVAAPSVLERDGPPQCLDALLARHAVVYHRAGNIPKWRFEGGEERDMVNGRIRLNDLDAIVDAAAAGFGLACLPLWLVRKDVDAGRLAVVPISPPCAPVDAFAVWPSAKYLPARVRLAIDTLAAELPRVTAGPIPRSDRENGR